MMKIDFNTFSNNSMLRNAVERKIEIIGEASNKVPGEFRKNNPDIEWNKPIAMRAIILKEGLDRAFEFYHSSLLHI
ncbi:MAG: DUF86 domain-containing protein [Saprospiraceae bacterium]|jgi:uncharacterized protein with HEPN domain|nr:DUF86 domain-containing protein [Saprospiraceae bacterium]